MIEEKIETVMEVLDDEVKGLSPRDRIEVLMGVEEQIEALIDDAMMDMAV